MKDLESQEFMESMISELNVVCMEIYEAVSNDDLGKARWLLASYVDDCVEDELNLEDEDEDDWGEDCECSNCEDDYKNCDWTDFHELEDEEDEDYIEDCNCEKCVGKRDFETIKQFLGSLDILRK